MEKSPRLPILSAAKSNNEHQFVCIQRVRDCKKHPHPSSGERETPSVFLFVNGARIHIAFAPLSRTKFACCDLIQLCSAPMKAPFCPATLLANQKFLFSRRLRRFRGKK
jgi:hypothetical protein